MSTRISSSATRFYKNAFPIVWFAVALAVLAIGLIGIFAIGFPRQVWPLFIALPTVFVFLGFLMKRLFGRLLDEVFDGGDSLVCRNRGVEEIIPLTNVMNVSVTTLNNPQFATLRLVKPGRFGDEISFLPIGAARFKPFARNPVIDDLIVRVDRARMRRVA